MARLLRLTQTGLEASLQGFLVVAHLPRFAQKRVFQDAWLWPTCIDLLNCLDLPRSMYYRIPCCGSPAWTWSDLPRLSYLTTLAQICADLPTRLHLPRIAWISCQQPASQDGRSLANLPRHAESPGIVHLLELPQLSCQWPAVKYCWSSTCLPKLLKLPSTATRNMQFRIAGCPP